MTDPTAGERVCRCACHAGHVGTGCRRNRCESCATPDAGDVEALAKVLDDALEAMRADDTDLPDVARAVLASPVLDAVRRKAGDERAEQAWDEGWNASVDSDGFPGDVNPYRAARIAGSPDGS